MRRSVLNFLVLLSSSLPIAGFSETELYLGTEVAKEDSFVSLESYKEVLLPTLQGPDTQIVDPVITDVSWSEGGGATISIGFEGLVFSHTAKSLKSTETNFRPGRVYVNGESQSSALIPVLPTEGSKLNGRFRKLLKGLPITEGVNTIDLVFPDPVTGLESSEFFTFTFEAPATPDEKPKVANLNREKSLASPSEIRPFVILTKLKPDGDDDVAAVEGNPFPRRLRISDNDTIIEGSITPISEGKFGYFQVGSKEGPQRFVAVPSSTPLSEERRNELLRVLVAGSFSNSLSERNEFLVGYCLGMFLNGGDLIASDGSIVKNALQISPDHRGLVIQGEWVDADGGHEPAIIPCLNYSAPEAVSEQDSGPLFDILWEMSRLYREDEPAKEDVGLALLTSDYDAIGVDRAPSTMLGNTLMNIVEPLESLNEFLPDYSCYIHGLYTGIIVSTAMQVDLPRAGSGDDEAVGERPLMSTVLQHVLDHFPDLSVLEEEKSWASAVEVPPGKEKGWSWFGWYYEERYSETDLDIIRSTASLLPDSIKPLWFPPALFLVALISFLMGQIWLLVEQFRTSLGWGFGQIGANMASCLLVIPGIVVAIIFCCLHWNRARRPVTLVVLTFALVTVAEFFVPSWVIPA